MPSLQFDTVGPDASFDWGDLAAIPDSDVDFSIELWVRFTTLTASVTYSPLSKGNATTGWFVGRNSDVGSGQFLLAFDGAARVAGAGLGPTINTWHYFCFVHRATADEVQGYSATRGDAALTVGTLTSSFAGPTTGSAVFAIGALISEADGFDGEVALARIWNKALSTAELQQLWDTRVVGKQFDNLVFNWDAAFDRGTDVAVTDVYDQVSGTASSTKTGTPARSTQDPGLRIYGMPEVYTVQRPQAAPSVTVTAVPAEATAAVPLPAITAQVSTAVTAVPAEATAAVPAPSVQIARSVTAVPAEASAEVPAPTVAAVQIAAVAAVAATVDAAVPVPTIAAQVVASVTAVPAEANAAVPPPSIAAQVSATVTAVPAEATAEAPPPSITAVSSGTVSVAAVPAEATAEVPAPTISAVQIASIAAVAAEATAEVPLPVIAAQVSTAVAGVPAEASAEVPAPAVSTVQTVTIAAVPAAATAEVTPPTIDATGAVVAAVETTKGRRPQRLRIPSLAASAVDLLKLVTPPAPVREVELTGTAAATFVAAATLTAERSFRAAALVAWQSRARLTSERTLNGALSVRLAMVGAGSIDLMTPGEQGRVAVIERMRRDEEELWLLGVR